MAKIIGIDLGTTYSAVAKITNDGRSEILRDEDGENLTPSVIVRESDETFYVGHDAKKESIIKPNASAKEFKRDMGTDRVWTIGGDTFSPVDLSALVLRKLKSIAEEQLGSVDEAVVTVPANFANQARQDTIAAGKKIGLKIRHIVNEPTAAAVCYAMLDDIDGTVAVYDLGGGTFDCSIVRIDGKNTEVLCSQGNQRLGGADFDHKLLELVNSEFQKQTGSTYELKENDFKNRTIEEYKKSLSKRDSVKILVSPPDQTPFNIEISRTAFENAISTFLTKAEMLVEEALSEASLTASDIDHVLLVGGSTRIPAVRENVKQIFSKEPKTLRNVDEVVALGAAYYGALNMDASKLNAAQKMAFKNAKVSEKSSHYFGTQILSYDEMRDRYEQKVSILIPKNADLPCSVCETYYTAAEGQQYVDCVVSQSVAEETDPQWVTKVWEGELGPFPPNRPAGKEIKITFSYDLNGVLKCEFVDVESNIRAEKVFNLRSDQEEQAIDVEKFLVE